jgi:hypothetical protein
MTDTTVATENPLTHQGYEVFDLVQYVNDGTPLEFEKAFGSIMRDRIEKLVTARQEEEAARFFNGENSPEDEEEEVENLDGDTEDEVEDETDEETDEDEDGEEA